MIEVYTDGGSRMTNYKITEDTKCAYAFCFKRDNQIVKKIVFGYGLTNNQMELGAIFDALTYFVNKTEDIIIYSDSNYSIQTLTNWSNTWEKNGWKKSNGKEIKNLELIKDIKELMKKYNTVDFVKVKGHSTDEMNNITDEALNWGMDLLTENSPKIFPVDSCFEIEEVH